MIAWSRIEVQEEIKRTEESYTYKAIKSYASGTLTAADINQRMVREFLRLYRRRAQEERLLK